MKVSSTYLVLKYMNIYVYGHMSIQVSNTQLAI